MAGLRLTIAEGQKLLARCHGAVISKSVAECLNELEKPKQPKFQERRETDRYKSKAEREYAELLDGEKRMGLIHSWQYEAIGLRLPDWGIYWPDFYIVLPNCKEEFREIKGKGKYAIRDKAKAKFLDARRLFDEFRFRMIQKIGEGFEDVL